MNKNEQKDPVDQRHCMVCDRWVTNNDFWDCLRRN
jgi:hypothetical protein